MMILRNGLINLKKMNIEELVKNISLLHKQNLSGRETEAELFEAGIKAGVIETRKDMYDEEEVFTLIDRVFHLYASWYRQDAKEWFEQVKKK